MTESASIDTEEIPDEILGTLSDYLDGTLAKADREVVDTKLAADPQWQRAHAELVETRRALSTLKRPRAPATFDQDVTETINKRSQGRFFGRKTFGDRVPFGALLVIALLALVVIGYTLWSSQTGSLRGNKANGADHSKTPPIVRKP